MGKIDINADHEDAGCRSYDDEPYQHVAFDGKFITIFTEKDVVMRFH